MGSLNNAHQENGGVLLYSGELILLYCDSVHCEIKSRGHAKGRIYLTTHRVIFTSTPLKQNANLKSFSAPFFSMFDLSLEQPIFGANAIKGKVRGDPEFGFELKFNKGGAVEFGQAMRNAAKQAATMAQQSGFTAPPPYSPTPAAANYYQAPDDVYQPNYPVGFVLPTQTFPDAPPPGFIYTSDVPPPYPGLITATTVTASVPGAAVHPNPAELMFGTSSVTPAIYPTATTQYVMSPMDPFSAAGGAYPTQNQNVPAGPGFNVPGVDHPPTYDEATKKKQ